MTFLLRLSFDGSDFHGWQVQKGVITVQSTLQAACNEIFTSNTMVTGCSRTDAGVHAKEFFCTVSGDTTVPCDRLPDALNSRLPDSLCVFSAVEVEDSFHPRYDCKGKEYMYDICVSKRRQPLSRKFSWQYCRSLDILKMREAADDIVGKHDFACFCAAGSDVADTVRTVYELRIEEKDDHVFIYISADGFLYNMVRIIVGTLVGVGSGRYDRPVKSIIESKDRTLAGQTAPAHGLYLNKVFY